MDDGIVIYVPAARGGVEQAGVALDNARLFEQNRRQVEELSVLHALARAVTGQLDRQALLEALRRQVPRVLAADTLGVLLLDDKSGEVDEVLHVRDGRVEAGAPTGAPRPLGLASIVLVQALMDHVEYERREGRNVLVLRKRLDL